MNWTVLLQYLQQNSTCSRWWWRRSGGKSSPALGFWWNILYTLLSLCNDVRGVKGPCRESKMWTLRYLNLWIHSSYNKGILFLQLLCFSQNIRSDLLPKPHHCEISVTPLLSHLQTVTFAEQKQIVLTQS